MDFTRLAIVTFLGIFHIAVSDDDVHSTFAVSKILIFLKVL